mgnify:CR=1 FL=1
MKAFISVLFIIFTLIISGCSKERGEEAMKVLKQEDSEDMHVAILFDNSKSFKPYIEDTLKTVEGLFNYLARKNREQGEKIKICLILIDTEGTILYNGDIKNLLIAHEDLKKVLRDGQSKFTNLSTTTKKAIYFLNESKAKEKILIYFSDMKASTPSYFPVDSKTVAPPPDFPWKELLLSKARTFVFFPPFEEWQLWLNEMKTYGIQMTAKFPQDVEVRKRQVYKTIFKDDE